VKAVLTHLGVDLKKDALKSRNVAAVIVSAVLKPFSGVGSAFDVRVSSIGSASSLNRGTLLMTSLKAADGQVYAIAQGRVVEDETLLRRDRLRFNRSVSGSIAKGAILEREVDFDFSKQKEFTYQLSVPDFTTSARIAKAINTELGFDYATAKSAGEVEVRLPYGYTRSPVEVIARIESLPIVSDSAARVVINQATGTVILGGNVKIKPVAISHNNLKIEVRDESAVSDERLLSAEGPAAAQIQSVPTKEHHVMLVAGASVTELVSSLNELGASSPDLIAILKNLESTGSLEGRIEVQ
jgi:flagellar P-ring protein precursor FlgI